MELDSADDSLYILYEKLFPKPDIQIVDVISGLSSEETEPQLQEAAIDICQDSPETAEGASQNIQFDDTICVLQENNTSQAKVLGTRKKSSKEDKTVAAPSRSKKMKIECGNCFDSLNEIEFDKDTHLCVRCGKTIEGLDNYVSHRQKKCFKIPVEDSALVNEFSSDKQLCLIAAQNTSDSPISDTLFSNSLKGMTYVVEFAEWAINSVNIVKAQAQSMRNMANERKKARQENPLPGSGTVFHERSDRTLNNVIRMAESVEETVIIHQQLAEEAVKAAENSKIAYEFVRKWESRKRTRF